MAYLVLEDGTVYEGAAFGSIQDTTGEVVFNTGMTGYEKVLTDPSYYGQIVAMTYPLIGNYGMNCNDTESSKSYVKGFIVRELCIMPSNWASEGTLEDFLKKYNICGIEGIDTRALTRKIREAGTMRGKICINEPSKADIESLKGYKINNPVLKVSCREKYCIKGEGRAKVAVIDYGLNNNFLRGMAKRGFEVTVYPYNTKAEEILKDNPDGIILSNGPGDPKDNTEEIGQIKKLIGKKPVFGICLGHQMLALAHGGDTAKLKYGHRGTNYPVKDLVTGKVYITCQNHSYTVLPETLTDTQVTHVNWNDMTCEGLKYFGSPSFGVQFNPEADPGKFDTAYIFDYFEELMAQKR